MLSFELNEPKTSACRCCGGTTTTFTRLVYRDGQAHGIYYAALSDQRPERVIKVVLSLGDFGHGSVPDDRFAFTVDLRPHGGSYEVALTEPERSPWANVTGLGQVLDRASALEHPLIKEVFHILDHAVLEDPSIRAYLQDARYAPN